MQLAELIGSARCITPVSFNEALNIFPLSYNTSLLISVLTNLKYLQVNEGSFLSHEGPCALVHIVRISHLHDVDFEMHWLGQHHPVFI